MGQVAITDENERRADYKHQAEAAIYRLETCAEEIGIAIEALKRCVAENGNRIALIHGNACTEVVGEIGLSISRELSQCLARTSD